MVERRRMPEQVPVFVPGEDRIPVGDVQQSREPVGADWLDGGTAMMVDAPDQDFCDTDPQALFEGLEVPWDVSPSGDFFVTVAPRDPPNLHIVLNWFDELNRLAPPGASR